MKNDESFTLPGKKSFDKLTAYIPFFQNPDNPFYEIRVTDYYYSPEVLKFVDDFYQEQFNHPFDWTRWTDRFWELSNDREQFDKSDIETLVQFLSTIVNADRFIEGTMAFAIDNGHILAVLERFREYAADLK